MLRGLPQLTISPTHNSSPNDLTLATSLSLTHTATRSLLASLTLASWLGRGWSPAPHHDTPVRSRSVAGATPQGARCVELRLEPQLEAARSLTSLCSPRLASLASPRSPRLACPRLASLDSPCSPSPRLPARLALPCLARLASPLHSLASPPRSPDLLARLASLRSSAAAPLATSSLASLEFSVVNLRRPKPSALCSG